MVAGGSRRGIEASSSRAAPPGLGEERVDEPPAFADSQEEEQLWVELCDHGTALGHATNRAETLQAAYNSSEQELVELRAAALETCQAVEEGEAQARSSLASRLRALGGHVSGRMHRALHLGVKKALGVVRSHYEVNLEAVASGYVVPEGVEDEASRTRRRWSRRTRLPLMLRRRSPRHSRSSCSRMLPTATSLRPEDLLGTRPVFV
jgi:hypothetical protein